MIEPWRRVAHQPIKAENAGACDGKPRPLKPFSHFGES
jgi:hypothetical protein